MAWLCPSISDHNVHPRESRQKQLSNLGVFGIVYLNTTMSMVTLSPLANILIYGFLTTHSAYIFLNCRPMVHIYHQYVRLRNLDACNLSAFKCSVIRSNYCYGSVMTSHP